MVRTCLRAAFAILLACIPTFGQTSPPVEDPIETSEPGTGHAIYVSGFEILNGGRNFEDLGQYPIQMLGKVRSRWYPLIRKLPKLIAPESVTTVIEFQIKRNGSLGKVATVETAGYDPLDAAATQAILSSEPFERLPEAYREKALKIRMHFGSEQPVSAETPFCHGPGWGAHAAEYVLRRVGYGVASPKAINSPDPEYSEKARRDKYNSTVLIAGTVDVQGVFTDLCVAQAAGEGLDEKALEAVATWKFQPATLQGEPVAVRLRVEVSFRLF